MQEKNKRIISITIYIIVSNIFLLIVWYLKTKHSMVVQRHPFTNTFIFLHITLVVSLLCLAVACGYLYYHNNQKFYFINSVLSFLLGIICFYFSVKNLSNSSLIIYPTTDAFIQDFRYLHTLHTFDSILLIAMIVLTFVLLFYNINYSYTNKYLL